MARLISLALCSPSLACYGQDETALNRPAKAIVDRDGAYKAKVHNDPSMKSAC
jgi:hypothetical protein